MSRCKPGDLAIVIHADHDPQALGAVVTIKRLRFAQGMPAWQVDPPFYWRDQQGKDHEVMWDDRDLQPIRGAATKAATARLEASRAPTTVEKASHG